MTYLNQEALSNFFNNIKRTAIQTVKVQKLYGLLYEQYSSAMLQVQVVISLIVTQMSLELLVQDEMLFLLPSSIAAIYNCKVERLSNVA